MSANSPVRVGVITIFWIVRHDVLLLAHLGDPERVDHVARRHLELDAPVDRHHENVGLHASFVVEAPGELLREHLDLERVVARVRVLREDDGAHDADRDHEDRRPDRPRDLEAGVPVDRRPVGVVVGLHPERPDRLDDHRGDEGEDPDADDRREPVGEDDPVHLLGGGLRQPRDQDRDEGRDDRRERGDHDHLDQGGPTDHRREPTPTFLSSDWSGAPLAAVSGSATVAHGRDHGESRRREAWAATPRGSPSPCRIVLASVPAAAEARRMAVVGPTQSWVTDGDVLAVTAAGGSTYVGGDFSLIGRATGSWAEMDGAGTKLPIRRVVRGSVIEAVTDGRGGWILRGDISSVGGVKVAQELVHLRASGRLDTGWKVRTDGEVYAIARVKDRLYVGGSFTELNGEARASLAAVDARSGAVLDWRPRVAGRTKDDEAEVFASRLLQTDDRVRRRRLRRVDGSLGLRSRRSAPAEGSAVRPGRAILGHRRGSEDFEGTATWSLFLLSTPVGGTVYAAGYFGVLGGERTTRSRGC